MRITLPAPAPTTCCFGGPDMKLLFTGSQHAGLGMAALVRFPLVGGIFMAPVDVPGVAPRRFDIAK